MEWSSPSNIAIVKYWGKKAGQLSQNTSVSFTLSRSQTRTRVEYFPRRGPLLHSFQFHGQEEIDLRSRVEKYLQEITPEIPLLRELSLQIQTENSFPHSCGVASSASAFSALALCLCEIEGQKGDFLQRTSHLARLGSGSACRSLYGPFSRWPVGAPFATPIENTHPHFLELRDTICLVDTKAKKISSSTGHRLMKGHPFARERYAMAEVRAKQVVDLLRSGDREEFIRLAEAEAMALHGLMLLSSTPYMLLRPASLAILEKIVEFRQQHKIPVGFTIDAGPNIHLLSFSPEQDLVNHFLQKEIAPLTMGMIEDFLGPGVQVADF